MNHLTGLIRMNQLTITTLADNCLGHPETTARGLLGEHGLSLLINYKGQYLLFDTGTGATIIENAKILNVNWNFLDAIVLSHAHPDHTGGLKKVLEATGKVKVYTHPDIFKPKFVMVPGKEPRYNGLPEAKEVYEKFGAQFALTYNRIDIAEGISIVGPINRKKPTDDSVMPNRYIKDGIKMIPDPFTDEQALVIKTAWGLLIVSGCAHNGLINTIEQVSEIMGEGRIFGLVGGLHLHDYPEIKLSKLANWLMDQGIRIIYCSHCTGMETITRLYSLMNGQVFLNYVGKKLVIDIQGQMG